MLEREQDPALAFNKAFSGIEARRTLWVYVSPFLLEVPMPIRPMHACACPGCIRPEDHGDRAIHLQMNLFFSRLDEQQRRWYAALESRHVGHGGDRLVSQITGISEKCIRRGHAELDAGLTGRPHDRIRRPGGGRRPVGKASVAKRRVRQRMVRSWTPAFAGGETGEMKCASACPRKSRTTNIVSA